MESKDKRIVELEALLKAALERIALLHDRIACLEQELAASKKNSSNSSQPPSSDIVKPPPQKNAERNKRKQGAQKGHPRKPFEENQIERHRTQTRCLSDLR